VRPGKVSAWDSALIASKRWRKVGIADDIFPLYRPAHVVEGSSTRDFLNRWLLAQSASDRAAKRLCGRRYRLFGLGFRHCWARQDHRSMALRLAPARWAAPDPRRAMGIELELIGRAVAIK
jgi:hypothetical protein